MKFFNSYVRQGERVQSESGSSGKIIYSPRIDEKGVLVLEATGKEDLSAYINSFAESCDIHVIMTRFANGETDVLRKRQGTYGDFIGAPTSLADMFNRVKAGEDLFNSLPVEVKKKFNNSFTEFAIATGEKDFFSKLVVEEKTVASVEPASVVDDNKDDKKGDVAE